jgi:hypothetical protein
MASSIDNKRIFFEALASALLDGSLEKVTLSQPRADVRWKRIVIRPFTNTNGTLQIGFDFFDGRQSERKNTRPEAALSEIQRFIPDQMKAAHARLTHEELIFEETKVGSYRLKRRPVSSPRNPVPSHNRQKNYLIAADSPFLIALGISNSAGSVRGERYDKYKQIQKFIEIIAELVTANPRSDSQPLRVVDFGSGKHYLTFALHAYLSSHLGNVRVTGVEQRPELVALGRTTAATLETEGLEFLAGSISSYPLTEADLVVALHACNTATDDALVKAIRAHARFICVAPCCHAYVRQHFSTSEPLRPMLRHGILEERFTEGLTDSLRVLTLEALGYSAKLFEFISPEHTAKNVMITASYTGQRNHTSLSALEQLKTTFSLPDFYLDRQLHDLLNPNGNLSLR